MRYLSLRRMQRVFMQKPAKDTEKTKIGLRSRRRTGREMYPRNKAGENFNLENHSQRSKGTLR